MGRGPHPRLDVHALARHRRPARGPRSRPPDRRRLRLRPARRGRRQPRPAPRRARRSTSSRAACRPGAGSATRSSASSASGGSGRGPCIVSAWAAAASTASARSAPVALACLENGTPMSLVDDAPISLRVRHYVERLHRLPIVPPRTSSATVVHRNLHWIDTSAGGCRRRSARRRRRTSGGRGGSAITHDMVAAVPLRSLSPSEMVHKTRAEYRRAGGVCPRMPMWIWTMTLIAQANRARERRGSPGRRS